MHSLYLLNDDMSVTSQHLTRKLMAKASAKTEVNHFCYDLSLSDALFQAVINLDEAALAALPPPIPGLGELVSIPRRITRHLVSPLFLCCKLHEMSAAYPFGNEACFHSGQLFVRFMGIIGRLLHRHRNASRLQDSPLITIIKSAKTVNDDYSNLQHRQHHVLSFMLMMPFQNAEQEACFVRMARRYGAVEPGFILSYSGMRRSFPACICELLVEETKQTRIYDNEAVEPRQAHRRINEIFQDSYDHSIKRIIRMIANSPDVLVLLPFDTWRDPGTQMTPLHIAALDPRLHPVVPVLLERFPMIHPAIRDSKGRTAGSLTDNAEIRQMLKAETDIRLRKEMPMVRELIRVLKILPSDIRRSILGDIYPAMGAVWFGRCDSLSSSEYK